MSWTGVTRAVQIRLCRYVLQRYLGQFLLEKISLDQLSVDLSSSSGNAEIKSVYLDVKGLNEISEANHWPILFVDGFIGSVCVEVPWITMLKDNSHVRVEGLQLTVQPKSWAEDLSLFESMYSSMMSSKQMAEEIFKESISEPDLQRPQYLTGLEQIIDTMFNRVIVTFENTTLRIEHLIHTNQSHYWTALEVRIDRFEYHDALASAADKTLLEENVTRSTKKAMVCNIELLVDKFNSAERNENNPDKKCGALCANSPDIESKPVLIAFLKGNQEVEISIEKGDEDDISPKIGVQVCLSELPIFIEPQQIMMLSALMNSFVGATSNENIHQESPCKALSPADFLIMEQDLQSKHNKMMIGGPPLGGLGTLHTWAGEQEEVQYFPMGSSVEESTISLNSQHPMSVQTEFNLKIGVVFVVILEETENTPDRSGHFFKETNGVPLRDVITVATSEFLPYKHFRLALYPVTLNGRTKSSSSHKVLEVSATIANAQLVRSEGTWLESILTSNLIMTAGGGAGIPFMRLKVNIVSDNSMCSEVTNINCTLGAVHMKYDRLLESRFIEMFEVTPANRAKSRKKFGSGSGPAQEVNLTLTCPQLSCELRFQALELANVQKKLRPDVLIVTLEKISVEGRISNDVSNEIKILFEDGYVDYRANENADPMQIVRVFSNRSPDDDGCVCASIVIQINSAEQHGNLLNEGYLDSMHQSTLRSRTHDMMSVSFYGKMQEEGPFVSRRVMYDKEKAENEEVILAGDKKQMQSFFKKCAHDSKIVIDITLPAVMVEFANRELFEIVYNRVLTDLFYVPSTECQRSKNGSHEFQIRQNFFGHTEKSSIDEEIICSTADGTEELQTHKPIKQNLLSLSMTVNEGSLLLGHGNPEKQEFYSFQLNPKQVEFYLVSCYQGDPNVSYVLLHAMDAEVYHEKCSDQPKPTHGTLSREMMIPSEKSRLLLSRIKKETFGKFRATNPLQDMLCITVKICANPNEKLKNVTLALSIASTAWRHVMTPARHFWITQLIELFTVRDFPVAGHMPSSVVTELHFSLEKSIIDYRPLHIPYNTILSAENFSLSSIITPKAITSTLRLILEDTSLFIAESKDQVSPPNIPENYVCVLNAGLLSLCLVITDGWPGIAFTASNDTIHIRTCSDSLFALQSLITYIAAEADLTPEREKNPKPSQPLSRQPSLQRTPPSSPLVQVLAEERSIDMNEMMEDAMCESFSERSDDNHSITRSLHVDSGLDASPPEGPKAYYNAKDDDFLVLEDLPGSGILKRNGQDDVRVLNGDNIVMIDDFLKIPTGRTDQLKAPTGFPPAVQSYTLKEMTLIWHVYGGKDFGRPRSLDTKLGPLASLGGADRNPNRKMELTLTKIQFRHEVYPPNQKLTSRQCLFIKDILIQDKVVTSEMNKFLYQFSNDSLPKQSNANMLTLKITHIAPDNECSIFMSLKPLRLNIDQEAIVFLCEFFGDLSSKAEENIGPIQPCNPTNVAGPAPKVQPRVYIRSFEFSPEVPIRLDYHGRHVDLDKGAIAGVLMGLGQFTQLELKLKRLVNKHGTLGFDRLVQYAVQEWINDIKKHQVQNVIVGVSPMHSIVQLCGGVKDLFWLPVEQYRKDGQIVRGLQRGTHSFTTNAAIAFLELTGKAIGTIQHAAELAYNLLSPIPNVPIAPGISEQPQDIREGVHNAYLVMANGINDTARNLAQAAATDTKARGITGAVGEVIRHIPPAVVRPFIDVSIATNNVINGVRYHLSPDSREEELAKWKNLEQK